VRGRTTFVIAHRLSTIQNCDLQLVLKGGKLVALTNDFQNATAILAGREMETATASG
jgi:ABC-type bacteriocin/lantibiotic exporter with double-glycine peptidase domain